MDTFKTIMKEQIIEILDIDNVIDAYFKKMDEKHKEELDEDGTYADSSAGTGNVPFDDGASGWYAQSVFKFAPAWRAGIRYTQLQAPDAPAGLAGSALDSSGHDPYAVSIMGDWTNSEFGRLRLQFSREELAEGRDDNQLYLQYIMSIGAHGAHPF